MNKTGYRAAMERGEETIELAIRGMRCAGCADTIAAALRALPGVASADVSDAVGLARVVGTRLDARTLTAAVAAAGYLAAPSGALAERLAARQEWIALLQAAALAALAVSGLFHWRGGAAALAVAALLLPGRGFVVGAVRSSRAGRATMDLLVALGAGAAATLALLVAVGVLPADYDHGHAALMLILFLRLGKWLEARVRARASRRLWSLLDALPAHAHRQAVDGGVAEVAASALAVGDRIEVAPGERLAADGVVVAGRSALDVAAVTGEPLPVDVAPGSAVVAGALVLQSPLVVRVTAAGGASQLGQMAAVVRKALVERAPIASVTERIAAWFVPAVIALAVATGLGWWLAGAGGAAAIGRALATIVVSCPCALALATPAALVAGTSAALAQGIVLKEAGALEALASVRVALLDKTGTLTEGTLVAEPLLRAPLADGDAALLRALAAASRHAAARAVVRVLPGAGSAAAPFVATEEQAGVGVRASHGGREWRLGRLAFVVAPARLAATTGELAAPDSAALVAFGVDGELRSAWSLRDRAKPTACATIAALAQLGLDVALVTGDRAAAAIRFGESVGLAPAAIHADCTPAAKAALVQRHQTAGRPVLFVGDGFNDGAALAVAAVGIACGGASATELARAAGRVVLQRGDPLAAAAAVTLGRATLRVIHQNLGLALAYNVIALPWAMGLLARFGASAPEPAYAGLAMAASSLAVVLNALRIARLPSGATLLPLPAGREPAP